MNARLGYAVRRILLTIPVLFVTSVFVFLLIRLVPGDPVRTMLGMRATPQNVATVRAQLGLDHSLPGQYWDWLRGALQGNLGTDFVSHETITSLLGQALPVTLELTVLAMALALLVGVPAGVLVAAKAGWVRRVSSGFVIAAVSIPDFWLGIMLVLLFTGALQALPPTGFVPPADDPVQNIRFMILPVVTLAAGQSAYLLRTTSAAMLGTLGEPYVAFLRAKGLRQRSVIYLHALRNASGPIVTVTEGLVKKYPVRRGLLRGPGAVHAVDGVSLTIAVGEILSLVGESGSGKTTLGRCVTGLTRPTAGLVSFGGADIASAGRAVRLAFRRRVQPVFQDPRGSLDPRWPIQRTLREPLDAHRIGGTADREERVGTLMDLVGLPRHLAGRRPRELSGGQQQRVAIAAALALGPELLVADEPVSALDVSVQAQILNLLTDLRVRLGLALLFISHDRSVVEHLSDRVAVMYLGRIVETGTVADVFTHPRHPYTRALIDAIPYPDPARRMTRTKLAGRSPARSTRPPGAGSTRAARPRFRSALARTR